ncbi:hypothetical protein N657DRAFT_691238 [Parathielavia appendiculata]|uniref:3'-5' exonuclease domain-containing protein n=1 Tax=Parathielavia appendiculata TaxID=2587402 RepID=A0AAN6TZT4_9PEZI|nr:hypothetical protein N657DRAFT_691238 [Parathielavia appendiculata]
MALAWMDFHVQKRRDVPIYSLSRRHPSAISSLIDTLDSQPTTPPSLYIDLEGVNLGRHGTIALVEVHVSPLRRTYLIDVHALGGEAFTAPSPTTGRTLQAVLEDEAIPKVFFDVRHDSDALHGLYGIRLAGVRDLQLMELATRSQVGLNGDGDVVSLSRERVRDLAACIKCDARLSLEEREAWDAAKVEGRMLFVPAFGGRYEVFSERPLKEEIMRYCVQDVQFLPSMWAYYEPKLTPDWEERVRKAERDRVALSLAPEFFGGKHMALAPEGWSSL